MQAAGAQAQALPPMSAAALHGLQQENARNQMTRGLQQGMQQGMQQLGMGMGGMQQGMQQQGMGMGGTQLSQSPSFQIPNSWANFLANFSDHALSRAASRGCQEAIFFFFFENLLPHGILAEIYSEGVGCSSRVCRPGASRGGVSIPNRRDMSAE
jgi:hypothetical protein